MDPISEEEHRQIDALVGVPSKTLALGGAYEGAARFDKQIAGWYPPLQSADADILPDKDLLDARSRDIGRNDAYVQGGATLHKDGIVGAFYMLNAKPMWEVLGKTEEWAETFQREVESLFTLWAESPMKWVDASRQNDLTSLVRLAVGVYTFTGETLATVEYVKQKGREFRTAIQMVDTDRLSTPETMRYDPTIRGGLKLDGYGAPQSAFIRVRHPRDIYTGVPEYWWKEVKFQKPWGRQQVIYIREQQRIDQTRAIADIVAGLKEIAITKKFRDVTLQKAVLAATYAATIESELPPQAVYEQLGMTGGAGKATTDYATQFLTALAAYTGSSKNMLIDGVKIPHLYPGTRLNFQHAADPAGVGQDFEQSLLRYIAAALNVSYEELARDYSKTNYSSARAAMATTYRFMQSRKRIVADSFASHVYRLWLEEAINQDRIKSFPASEAPMLYTDGFLNLMFDALTNCVWIGAARGQIDELKETQAAVLRIKYGLSTHEDELSRMGKDWRQVYSQLEREAKERDDRKIVLFEDNSVNAASGTPRQDQQDGTSGQDSNAQ